MIKGKGIYAWMLFRCEGGDMAKVVQRLKQAQMTHVITKIADESNANFNAAYIPDLISKAHAEGIKVLGYHYVYGKYPELEAKTAIIQLERYPELDGLVIDAEVEYRDLPDNDEAARTYCQTIRDRFPDLLMCLSTFRYPSYHRNFPYDAFLEYCQINMPQVYWQESSGTVPYQLERTIEEYKRYISRPIVPTGSAYTEHDWTATAADQRVFVEEAQKHGLPGCNWWEYYHAFHLLPNLGQMIVNTPFKEKEEEVSQPLTKLYYPCDQRWPITQRFGVNPQDYTISRGHNGVDWGIPVGNPGYAAEVGDVIMAVEQTYGYGRHVRIKHSHGMTIYGHLSRIDVKVGDRVEAGQVIGLTGGATSDPYAGMSTGPHLHFEYRLEYPIDPPVPGSYQYNAVDVLPLLIPHELPEPSEDGAYYWIQLTGNFAMRSAPGVDGTVTIGYALSTDASYKSFEKAKDSYGRDWYKITREGKIGWIAGYTKYSTITKINPEPTPTPTPTPTPNPTPDWEIRFAVVEDKVDEIQYELNREGGLYKRVERLEAR